MPIQLNSSITAVLESFQENFGFRLLHHPNLCPENVLNSKQCLPRQDVTVHALHPYKLWLNQEQPVFQKMRLWLLDKGIMLVKYPTDNITYYLVVPIIPVELATAFHATSRRNLESIMEKGLLPGDSANGIASSGNRFDCEGNIYVCPTLGNPEDAGQRCTFSAHWWRDHKSKESDDKDWIIIRLDRLNIIPGLITNRDYMSNSGVILTGVEHIPSNQITVAWPSNE